jgi:adenylate kinase
MRNIILLAPPAAGKGPVAELLKERDGYVQLSTGNILREMALEDEELNAYLKTGKLVDDKMIMEILRKKLLTLKENHYILDGVPRTVNQAVLYEELANELELDRGVVIYLNVPREELEKRIVSRIVCPECGASYSLTNEQFKPKQEGICDHCGAGLIKRKDDTKEAFDTRYDEYQEKTMPLIQYYKYRKDLNEVDSLEPEEVYGSIKKLI